MFKKKISEVIDNITDDLANQKFYSICGSAYIVMLTAYLIGFTLKINMIPIVVCSFLFFFVPLFFFVQNWKNINKKLDLLHYG